MGHRITSKKAVGCKTSTPRGLFHPVKITGDGALQLSRTTGTIVGWTHPASYLFIRKIRQINDWSEEGS